MKTLLIMRHADPHVSAPDGTDFARALTTLGEAQAAAQGHFLAEGGLMPERILASAAVRANDTAHLVAAAARAAPPVEARQELYNAPGDTLLEQVRELSDEVGRLLLVAHMPGVGELASLLVTEHVDLNVKLSPATLVQIVVDTERWRDVDYGTGVLLRLRPPPGAPV